MKLARWLVVPLLVVSALAKADNPGVAQLAVSVGDVRLERMGERRAVTPDAVIGERDVLGSANDAAARVMLGDGIQLEIGEDTQLAFERLPAGADRKSPVILSLQRGSLRIQWSKPGEGSPRRLVVYFGSQHAILAAGSFDFSVDEVQRACVSAGSLEVVPGGNSRLRSVPEHSCYRAQAGQAARIEVADPRFRAALDTSQKRLSAVEAAAAAVAATPPPSVAGPEEPASAPLPVAQPPPPPPAVAAVPPKPALPAPAAPAQDWALNLATLGARDAADKLCVKMKAAGYSAVVMPVAIAGRPAYRVQIRGYATAASARAAEPVLARDFGFKNLWPTLAGH